MISEQELLQIRLLSDYTLYPSAVAFMNELEKPLPGNQANGLLNVSFANSYDQLVNYLQDQQARTTWPEGEKYIQQFYEDLEYKLIDIEQDYLPVVTQSRQEVLSEEDTEEIKMLLAREFLQHILAENAYREAKRNAEYTGQRRDRRFQDNRARRHDERRQPFNTRGEQQR